jgi:hypothetical protein
MGWRYFWRRYIHLQRRMEKRAELRRTAEFFAKAKVEATRAGGSGIMSR